MCGRFCLDSDAAQIISTFNLHQNIVLTPRYNIAPLQLIPVIRTSGILEFITWGFRPDWLKPEQNSFINARIETLSERPAFKHAFRKQRCLIIATGFYEWKQIGTIKQPYFFSLPENKLFAFGGIYTGDTCAIITTQASQKEMVAIHQRMPLIITSDNYSAWLDPKTNIDKLQQQIQVTRSIFNVFAVSTKVNNPQNDFKECIKALN